MHGKRSMNLSDLASLEELLAFERLLSGLSARFANVAADQVVAEIESALKQLIRFLGFGRGTFAELSDGGGLSVLCSAATDGFEPLPTGPVPADRKWFERELLSGCTVALRSFEEYPPEAAEAAERYRQAGINSQLLIPLTVDGNIVAMIAFVAFKSDREWPDEFIAQIRVIGEVMAQTLVRKRSEAALLATQSELARVTGLTAVGQVAASIAHEINQPLMAIVTAGSACLRWLADPTPDRIAEARDLLNTIISEGNRASQVIDAVRAMYRNDSREKTMLDINLLIRDVLALQNLELRKRQVSLQTELTPKPLPVLADRVQLQQVISNLVRNAIEAMDAVDGRTRILRVKSGVSEGNGVLITVEDTGPGVDPKNVERIFHPFFTTKSNGTGMGLSICQSIIEAHDGRISVSSAADGGTVFQIALPVGDAASAER